MLEALGDPLNIGFLLIMLVVFQTSLPPGHRRSRQWHYHRLAPALLTGLGILGTFAGIMRGLLAFDVGKVAESVPLLLHGMTTAFLTSIAGLTLSLTHRVISLRRSQTEQPTSGNTLGDVVDAVQGLRKTVSTGQKSLVLQLEQLAATVGGTTDTSLISQITLFRTESRDSQVALRRSLDSFAEKVSELGSKALIEALEGVIRDFNANLTSQFGDNFKELNAAVKALVQWQDQYRVHLENLQARFEAVEEGLNDTRRALTSIVGVINDIPAPLNEIGELLNLLRSEHEKLVAILEAYSQMRDKAVEAFPQIERRVVEIVDTLGRAGSQGMSRASEASEIISRAAEELAVREGEATAHLRESARQHAEESRANS